MRVIKSYVNTERPGKWLLSCQATGGWRHRRGGDGHLNRKKPTNQLPVRFVASRLCLSCSSCRGHDRICNSPPLFTLRRPGFTSRQCGVVAWLRLTSGKGLSPLIQAISAGGGGPGQYKAEQQQCCCGTVKIPFKTCVVFWALWDCSILLLAVMTKIHASCTSEQKHNISGFRLPPSQRSRIWCWAYKQMCYRIQKKKKPLDVSCKYLTAVNVIAYKVIFKCSFKHPHNGFGCLLADHVTPPE